MSVGVCSQFFRHPVALTWMLVIIALGTSGGAMGWTYHFSEETMNWMAARQWCWTNNYTDMVAIQTKEENDYLTTFLPDRTGAPYYWIGIRKINGNWTWIGTNGTWAPDESWAPNEPNDKLGDEFCVEMYVNSGSNNHGKWNDDPCANPKYPVCYKKQCNQTSCNGRGSCLESINNFTCVCEPGFEGNKCQTVVTCEEPITPDHGRIINCSGPHGNTSLNSSCSFLCLEGFHLSGSPEFRCNSSRMWDATESLCTDMTCDPLSVPDGYVNCSGDILDVGSTCQLSCVAGILLLASPEVICSPSGVWTGIWGIDIWSRIRVLSGWRPVCASYQRVLQFVTGGWLLSTSCCICCCFSHHRKKKKQAQRREADNGVMPSIEMEQPIGQ